MGGGHYTYLYIGYVGFKGGYVQILKPDQRTKPLLKPRPASSQQTYGLLAK